MATVLSRASRFTRRADSRSRSISSVSLTIEEKMDTADFDRRPPKEELVFGTTLSDHMLMIEWSKEKNWMDPRIIPRQDLNISPAASSLHYGIQCFEGMKAYRSIADDSIRLFRPDMNMKRLSSSMDRLQMPGFDFNHSELIDCIENLVLLDQKWIPEGEGDSLYLRPTVIATHKFLGLAAPDSLLLFCITSPVGPYYKSGFAPIRLTTDTPYVRAWPGGTGAAKVGGNYASTMKPQAEAAAKGYSQVLWLFGDDESITEVGSMNVFFFLINKETSRPELVTAPLDRGDILPGVTRDSILQLTRSWGEFDVSERFPTMPEIAQAAKEGRLIEAFGAGTAAVVTPISCIEYQGNDIEIPATGKLTQRIWDEITGIQYGKIEGPEGWSIPIGDHQ
jgi:branched-chain amino acid aminotransferase